jgi:hypothetical protein
MTKKSNPLPVTPCDNARLMTNEFWQSMREDKLMLVDAPQRKIAVFANEAGMIALATREDDVDGFTTICAHEINDFMELFKRAADTAIELDSSHAADYEIWKASRR